MRPCTFMLAPMEDVTDAAMRTLCHRHGADVLFTEMARFDSLARRNKSTLEKVKLVDSTPTWIQIVGSNEQQLKRYLHDFEPQKGFLGFNFNLGCPSPNLITNGTGAAMVRRIAKTQKLLSIVYNRGYQTSIKMRLGLNNSDKQKQVYLNLIRAVNTSFFIVHSRVASDTYATPADHSILQACVDTGKTIYANGDIDSKEQLDAVLDFGVKGVMIGRAAICNPGIFSTLKNKSSPTIAQLKSEYVELTKQFQSASKYSKNVLKHLGKPLN